MERVMQFMFVVWASAVLIVWVLASFASAPKLQLAEVPPSVVTLLGLLLTGKVAQTVAMAIVTKHKVPG